MLQANVYAVPFAFAQFGFNVTSKDNAVELSSLYYRCVRKSLPPTQWASLFAEASQNPQGFALNRTAFGSALETYFSNFRNSARDVLHLLFCVPRGSPSHIIPDSIAARVDDVHRMLGLANNEALIGPTHPVYKEYPQSIVGLGPLRFFASNADGAAQIALPAPGSETLKFMKALGKSKIHFVHR